MLRAAGSGILMRLPLNPVWPARVPGQASGEMRNKYLLFLIFYSKGWGQSVKLGPHSAIWGKLGTALQAYTLNPCTKFPPNPTSRKVNT